MFARDMGIVKTRRRLFRRGVSEGARVRGGKEARFGGTHAAPLRANWNTPMPLARLCAVSFYSLFVSRRGLTLGS
jgi:hypothetical protein